MTVYCKLQKEKKVQKRVIQCFLADNCFVIWASTQENLSSRVCEQHRPRPACASAQSDQRLCYSLFESVIFKLAISEILVFQLVSVAEETGFSLALSTGFSLALSETPKTGFVATRPIL